MCEREKDAEEERSECESCGYSCATQVCQNTASLWQLDRPSGVRRPPTHTSMSQHMLRHACTPIRASRCSAYAYLFVCTCLFTNTQWGLCLRGTLQCHKQWETFKEEPKPEMEQKVTERAEEQGQHSTRVIRENDSHEKDIENELCRVHSLFPPVLPCVSSCRCADGAGKSQHSLYLQTPAADGLGRPAGMHWRGCLCPTWNQSPGRVRDMWLAAQTPTRPIGLGQVLNSPHSDHSYIHPGRSTPCRRWRVFPVSRAVVEVV